MRAGEPALTRLLGPAAEAFPQSWGRRPLLVPARDRPDGGDLADLLDLAGVDELLSSGVLRTPFLRMAKDGRTLPESAFTAPGGVGAGIPDQVDPDRVRRLVADGATVVLQGLHRTWPAVRDLVAQLGSELGHPVQANAYVTPPQNQGFDHHYDVHDVLVLQLHGEKRWVVHEPVLPAPLRDQAWQQRREQVARAAAGPPALEATLRAGDCLYLPRGYIHAARALGGTSAHLTLGIQQWTRHHLAEALLTRARRVLAADDQVRASLPAGLDHTAPEPIAEDIELARRALVQAVASVPDDEVAALLADQDRSSRRAEPVPPLAQLAAADRLSLEGVLRLRHHLAPVVEPTEDGDLQVRTRAGTVRLAAEHGPALERLQHAGALPVAELAADRELALQAARSLVVGGLAVVTPAP
ncbi:cupin domain-containing protein [Ornithinicoccus halotolerans]|uniref:cupin domain-containing protein n=1 Tax=Ornithinicoccus halotolerans TaxID=1748220 RepID=UPI001E62BB0F|nr:cupin domain-containing protein [Ornithinicoccus halotolerans]